MAQQDVNTDVVVFEQPVGDQGHVVSLRIGDRGVYLLLEQGLVSMCTILGPEVSKKLRDLVG